MPATTENSAANDYLDEPISCGDDKNLPVCHSLQPNKFGASPMSYYVYKDTAGLWRWYLEAANNRKIANSGESYHNKADCLSAIALVKGSAGAPVKEL